MTTISGWGRYPIVETELLNPRTIDAVRDAIVGQSGFVARGNGRSYGDAAIGRSRTVAMTALDRIRSFDTKTGHLTVEAGILLADLIETFLPRGFFPPVVPGTRFVTVGGSIAADVHGKNHHRDGGFGAYVERLQLLTADGELMSASRTDNSDLFFATIGGMGLTGTIIEATLRLNAVETGWIRQRTIVAPDLAAAIAALDENDDTTYSVAWIDCTARGAKLGRSLIFLGEHAHLDELDDDASQNRFPPIPRSRLSVPMDLPAVAVNRWSVAAFNEIYFQVGKRGAAASRLVAAGPYFFPLDNIGAWNRLYGRRGFVQYQCVIPTGRGPAVLAEILGRVASRGGGSFLAVLKKLGRGEGLLSFPLPGYTLSLDFPVTADLLGFLDELDSVLVPAGGRVYLAKDARQTRETFEAGYPDFHSFCDIRHSVDPQRCIRSRQAERLGL